MRFLLLLHALFLSFTFASIEMIQSGVEYIVDFTARQSYDYSFEAMDVTKDIQIELYMERMTTFTFQFLMDPYQNFIAEVDQPSIVFLPHKDPKRYAGIYTFRLTSNSPFSTNMTMILSIGDTTYGSSSFDWVAFVIFVSSFILLCLLLALVLRRLHNRQLAVTNTNLPPTTATKPKLYKVTVGAEEERPLSLHRLKDNEFVETSVLLLPGRCQFIDRIAFGVCLVEFKKK